MILNNNYTIKSKNFKSLKRLVITLHGYGTSGEDFAKVGEIYLSQKLDDTIFLFPDAPYECATGVGREWFDLEEEISPNSLRFGLDKSAPILAGYIERVSKEYDCDEINLMGFSQGSMMALEMVYYPGITKIIAYSGLFAPSSKKSIKSNAKVLLVHSDDDQVVPFDNALNAKSALKKLGIDVQLKTCHGIGHSISLEGWDFGSEFLSSLP